LHPIGHNIGVDGGGGWSWGLHSRRWRDTSVGGILLTHLLFIIRVTEDDDVAVARRPKKTAVDVTEELLGELLIPRGIREKIFLI
jgi:hypothetical protein